MLACKLNPDLKFQIFIVSEVKVQDGLPAEIRMHLQDFWETLSLQMTEPYFGENQQVQDIFKMSRIVDYFVICGYDHTKGRSGNHKESNSQVIQRFPEKVNVFWS